VIADSFPLATAPAKSSRAPVSLLVLVAIREFSESGEWGKPIRHIRGIRGQMILRFFSSSVRLSPAPIPFAFPPTLTTFRVANGVIGSGAAENLADHRVEITPMCSQAENIDSAAASNVVPAGPPALQFASASDSRRSVLRRKCLRSITVGGRSEALACQTRKRPGRAPDH
jgi:hypothetical protein